MAVEEDPPPARGEEELDILDHGALVADMKRNDQVSLEERAKKAKSNRIKQLQIFEEFEKRGAAPATAGGRHAKIKFPPDVPLMDAAAKGAVDDMRELMKKGLDPNANNYEGLTALHNCCIDGNIEMVKLLLDHGAKVNVSDKDGWTPLHAAATCGFTDIVKALIKAGAELLAINGDGDMPFDIAEDENTLNVIEEAMRSQGITNEQVQEKRTELHVTMFEDVKELVKENMSLDAFVNEEGATLLHVAIAHGFNDVVEFLLDNGASVDIGDCDGWEPVHVAAFFNNIVALTLLVTKRQANLRALNNSGVDPLKLADSLDTRKAVQSLLKTDQPQLKREHKELEVMASLDSLASDDTVAENEPLSFLEGTSRETNIDEVLQNKIDSPIDKNEIQSSKSSLIGDGDFMPVLKRVESISTKRSSIREAKKQAPTIKNANFIRRDSYEAYDNSYDLLLVKKKPDIQKVKSTQGSETEVNPKQSLEEIEESEDCEKIQEGIRSELSQGPTKIDVLPAAASGTVHSEPIFANEEPIANSNELTGSVHPSPFGNDPPEHVYELQEEEMAEADKPGNTYVNTAEPLNSSTLKNNEYTLPSDSESSDLEQAALGALETSKTYPSAVLKKEEPASTTLYDNGSRGTSIYDTEPRIYLANNAEKPVAPSSDKKAGSSLYKNDTPLTSQDEKSSSLYENEISNTSLYDDPSLTNGSFSSSSANNNPSATTYQNGIFTADDNLYEVDSSSISSQESDSQERRKKENPSQVGALGVAQPGKKEATASHKKDASLPSSESPKSTAIKKDSGHTLSEVEKSREGTPKTESKDATIPKFSSQVNKETIDKSSTIISGEKTPRNDSRAPPVTTVSQTPVPLRRKKYEALPDNRGHSQEKPVSGSLQELKLRRQQSRQTLIMEESEGLTPVISRGATNTYATSSSAQFFRPPDSPSRSRKVFKAPEYEPDKNIFKRKGRCVVM